MANKPQALIKLSGPNRKVSFISEDGETINAIKEGINTYKLSGSDAPAPIIESVYTYKGSKATYGELPIENNKVGDVWNVVAANNDTPAGTNYAWTGTTWDALGGTYVDTNTWRPIKVGGTEKLADSSTPINFAGSGGTSVSYADGTITVSSPSIGTESTQVAAGNHTHSGYAATSHTHSEYAASSHNHTTSQISDFPTLATVATSGSYSDLKDKPTIPAAYTLPAATTEVLGGVKIDDSTIKINNDGQLYANVESSGGSSSTSGPHTYSNVFVSDYKNETSIRTGHAIMYPGTANEYDAGEYEYTKSADRDGEAALAIGVKNIALGKASFTLGYDNNNFGNFSVLSGNGAANDTDGVVINNNHVYDDGIEYDDKYPYIYYRYGGCGFKGISRINVSGGVGLLDLGSCRYFTANIQVLLRAKIGTTNTEKLYAQTYTVTYTDDGIDYERTYPTSDNIPNLVKFYMNNNKLYMSKEDNITLTAWDTYGSAGQVGLFFTLLGHYGSAYLIGGGYC